VAAADALQGWHDLYVTVGAAAATLVGLLFVGLSLHIRSVIAHREIRSLARVTLTDFFAILVVALAVLQPADEPQQIGGWLLGIATVSLGLMIRPAADATIRRGDRAISVPILAARFGVSAVALAALAGVGLYVLATSDVADALSFLFPVVVVVLVVAVRNTWDILVTVAERTGSAT
jgi:hypothetical protein